MRREILYLTNIVEANGQVEKPLSLGSTSTTCGHGTSGALLRTAPQYPG